MASLPSVALSPTLKLETEVKKHPSASSSIEKESQSRSISYQKSSVSTQLDERPEPARPLDFDDPLSLTKEGTEIECAYYVSLLKECIKRKCVSGAQIVHAHIVKTGTQKEFFLMTFLVNVYAKCGAMTSARKVFDNLPKGSVVAWTSLLKGYVQNSESEVAVEVFVEMMESGSFPSYYTLGIALNACSSLSSIELGKQFHAFIVKYRIDQELSIGNALCSLYSKFGILKSAVKAFRRVRDKDVISWTAVISACVENGAAAMGLRFFIEMLNEDVKPNEVTLTTVLSLCCLIMSLGLGKQVHSLSIKLSYGSNRRLTNSIMYLYLKCRCIKEAEYLFSTMETVNLVTWNALIAGYSQAMELAKDDVSAHRSGNEALGMYFKLNRSGMKPDLFTLSSILTICGGLVALEQGEQIHAQTIKSGFLSDVVVGTALVNMYNKCGSIEKASKTFVEMSTRTLISWTTMITSFARHGHSQQALQLFEDMRLAGLRPNQITFVGVLAACSQAGMVNEALEYFQIMKTEYKLKPVMDHYGCLIDMFVRLGRTEEAFDIVKKMDFEPSEFIWNLLIAGCRNHGHTELGFCAAEQLLKLKPRDIETYVMLLNMYISAERWKDVSQVRKLMKEEKVGKLNDWSWISIKEKTRSFKTNDRLHPGNAEIYTFLEELLNKAKSYGYESGENVEVVDEEEEAEEKTFSYCVYHSEKLAVAYGLLHTEKSASIRVVKSIGMCKDCHNFMKIISLLASKEIIVRDSKRLHKFVNGQCSCADFAGIF
ncbi:hypothetical protein K2173_028079 [Erythroxylum novogranatense]|uniref:DYW domain-containing protein n=1 Tax=Erythroxylum novogranatense TaxID=1862640 RepID=A0AAV8U0U4_9ROSI|nr:hypothetical protein K2173_028079 [Erythroxylum novogranatense]